MQGQKPSKDGRRAGWIPGCLASVLIAFGLLWYLAAWPYTVITVDKSVASVSLNGRELAFDKHGYADLRLPPWKSRIVVTDKKRKSSSYLIWPQSGTNDSDFIVINGLEINAPDVVGIEKGGPPNHQAASSQIKP